MPSSASGTWADLVRILTVLSPIFGTEKYGAWQGTTTSLWPRGRRIAAAAIRIPAIITSPRSVTKYTFENTAPENKSWLGTLPPSLRFALGPLQVELCHGSPRQTNEFLWKSASPEHLLFKFTQECNAEVVCCTHTGIKWHRALAQGRHFFNVGVIGRPENDGATNVWYTLLEYEGRELKWGFRPLHYDHEVLVKEMKREGLPEPFITTTRSGWWTTCLEIMPAKERACGLY